MLFDLSEAYCQFVDGCNLWAKLTTCLDAFVFQEMHPFVIVFVSFTFIENNVSDR